MGKTKVLRLLLLAAVAGGTRVAIAQEVPAGVTANDTTRSYLRPGDVIRLRVWREPDLSGDFPVDETGIVTFPKIGQFNAFEYSPQSLKKKMLDAYAVYLRNPSIEVTMMRRINILGAVQKPGLYPVDATMTVADAVAIAGGATPNGDPHHVDLMRKGVKIEEKLSQDTNLDTTPLRSGDQLFVPERSFIERNATLVATVVSVSASLVIAVFLK
jgi:polysaccharide export outer membrane protein